MALDGDKSPGGSHLHRSAPGVDKWIQRVREWLQDFF
jgi:hypothetical protein